MRSIIAIDPGVVSGVAVFGEIAPRSWRLVSLFDVKMPVGGSLFERAGDVLSVLAIDREESYLVCEGQFYVDTSKRKGSYQCAPWDDVASGIECRCSWQHAAEALGFDRTSTVLPKTWTALITARCLGKDSKARSKSAFSDRWPGRRTNEHERDAALIGVWLIGQCCGRLVEEV